MTNQKYVFTQAEIIIVGKNILNFEHFLFRHVDAF